MRFSVISRKTSSSFPHFRTSCNVVLVLFHVTDVVCFYVKTLFMFQKTKNKQINCFQTYHAYVFKLKNMRISTNAEKVYHFCT